MENYVNTQVGFRMFRNVPLVHVTTTCDGVESVIVPIFGCTSTTHDTEETLRVLKSKLVDSKVLQDFNLYTKTEYEGIPCFKDLGELNLMINDIKIISGESNPDDNSIPLTVIAVVISKDDFDKIQSHLQKIGVELHDAFLSLNTRYVLHGDVTWFLGHLL